MLLTSRIQNYFKNLISIVNILFPNYFTHQLNIIQSFKFVNVHTM